MRFSHLTKLPELLLARVFTAQLWRAPHTVSFRVITLNTISILIKSQGLWIIERKHIRLQMKRLESRRLEDKSLPSWPCKQLEMIAKTALAYIANVEKY